MSRNLIQRGDRCGGTACRVRAAKARARAGKSGRFVPAEVTRRIEFAQARGLATRQLGVVECGCRLRKLVINSVASPAEKNRRKILVRFVSNQPHACGAGGAT
jgi:hypothetical protein